MYIHVYMVAVNSPFVGNGELGKGHPPLNTANEGNNFHTHNSVNRSCILHTFPVCLTRKDPFILQLNNTVHVLIIIIIHSSGYIMAIYGHMDV